MSDYKTHCSQIRLSAREEMKKRTAFSYGASPHAGIALGIDRLLMILTDASSIRDVIAFPLNSKAQDLMMGAPGFVSKDY